MHVNKLWRLLLCGSCVYIIPGAHGQSSQAPVINAVTNAASFLSGPIAPGEMVTLFGSRLGPSTLTTLVVDRSNGRVATALANTSILFNGIPAPLIYVSDGQSSAIVPYGVAGAASVQVVVNYQGTLSQPLSVAVRDSAPGIFAINSSGAGQGAILNQNATINSVANPARPGSIISIFATGEGATVPPGIDGQIQSATLPKPLLPVSVKIGGFDAQITYAGAAPNSVAGFFQVNAIIPTQLTAAGSTSAMLTIGNVTSQTNITVAVAAVQNLTTVVLVHGILQGGNPSAPPLGDLQFLLLSRLDRSRFVVDDTFDWGRCAYPAGLVCPSDCSIQEGAQELALHILKLSPSGNVILVGYSLGGLLARDLLLNNYYGVLSNRRNFLVTLGTPNLGYPHLAIDDLLICSSLGNQMASDFRAQQSSHTVTESNYLYNLNNSWTSTAFATAPVQWLAMSGTFCPNPLRTTVAGCPDYNPYNDGVVCDQSARFNISGSRNLPTFAVAAPDFAHTKYNSAGVRLLGGSLFQSCDWTTPGRPYSLFEPPNPSGVLDTIVTFISQAN